MLLETKSGGIGARVVFDERQKHDSNSPINLDLNEEVIMWLFVRSTGNNSIVTQS